ncbi:hypothetical protein TU94_25850 [Streptomyces cyaneogriseus subsp. noncyanogenus]|uniref:Uncharacterized protein n=1 Tax=Streptomyces cyaneogriseus subsp. noncyanogenus TaxID=477245 RepID=A0A0C5GIV2_9ACTN|nr:hypothetical protein TU94_25850 [Streptomyces cyaneogriseus subsp. noncyanogenus]
MATDGRAEGIAEGDDGMTLGAQSQVGVDANDDADVGVVQQLSEDDEMDALLQEQAGSRMPDLVEADASEAGAVTTGGVIAHTSRVVNHVKALLLGEVHGECGARPLAAMTAKSAPWT